MEIRESDRTTCPECQAPIALAVALPESNAVPLDVEPDPWGSVRLDYFDGRLTAQVVPHFEREQTVATYGPLYRRHSVMCGADPTVFGGPQ